MYKIRLPNFEGPFDLLLYFIKRDELNIYDIPISKITAEFLNYIKVIKYFDLELAGEFIVMATTLMYVKTQMLLPRSVAEDGTALYDDPRTQLVQRILEYKQFKDASKDLSNLANEQRYSFYRKIFDADNDQADGGLIYKNANLFDLMKAFKTVLERDYVKEEEHVVEMFKITVEDRIKELISLIEKKKRISFFELMENTNKPLIVVTFLALLEMMKMQKIFVHQAETFDDIIIAHRPNLN